MNRRLVSILILAATVTVAALTLGCGGFPDGSPAKVGDVYIDGAAFTEQVDSYATQYGVSKETDPDTYNQLANDVLGSMVNTELAVQMAPELGITVTEQEIQARLDQLAQDYYEGDPAALEEAVKGEGMTMEELEAQISDFLLVGKVQEQVTADVAQPTDAEIAAYYEEHKSEYMTEQTIEARHILVGVGGVTVNSLTGTTTTESTTDTTTSTDTSTSESTTTTASTTTTTLPEVEWAQALATASQVRVDLLGGASWSTLAARYSADLDTKDKGGELGVVTSGQFVDTLGQEFDTMVFTLALDQISEPTKTEHGYEVIQVTKINEPQQKTLEEASADIAALLLTEAQGEAWNAFIADATEKIGVKYARGYEPTTTTVLDTTTLAPSEETTTEP